MPSTVSIETELNPAYACLTTTDPNFDQISICKRSQAYIAFAKKDAKTIMKITDLDKRALLLLDNINCFHVAGIYEEALHAAMIGSSRYTPEAWYELLSWCDIDKLRATGDALPTKPITVYRGVVRYDDIENYIKWEEFVIAQSWTRNKHIASWFANWNCKRSNNPPSRALVYSTKVNPENIILCTNDRLEEEVVIDKESMSNFKLLKKTPVPFHPNEDNISW